VSLAVVHEILFAGLLAKLIGVQAVQTDQALLAHSGVPKKPAPHNLPILMFRLDWMLSNGHFVLLVKKACADG
jgi:hypothetical protein